MQYSDIKKQVASNLGYVDSAGAILASKDVSETDIGNWVNSRYIDDIFSAISSQYPEDFKRKGVLNFYKTSGTVSAASTSTTLVATGNIFNNGMVGDNVYNSTDEEIAVITAYTSATTVTIDTTIADTWDGDTIYIIGHEFGLGGNAVDLRGVAEIAVKYSADDEDYVTCEKINEPSESDKFNYYEGFPVWYPTTVSISGVPTSAIGILPEPKENVANGILIKYTEQPAALSADADVPRLPLGSHSALVYGATADGLRKLMRLDESRDFEQLYQAKKQEAIASYLLTRGAGIPRVRPSRRLRRMVERTI